jgi:hypothetical protein
VYDLGLLQLLQLPESSLHWKVESSSLLLKLKDAVRLCEGLLGPDEIEATGAVKSDISQIQLTALPVLFEESVALTWNWWVVSSERLV